MVNQHKGVASPPPPPHTSRMENFAIMINGI